MALQEASVESIPNLLLGRFLGTRSLSALQHALQAMPRHEALLMLRTIVLQARQATWMRCEAIEALLLLGGEEAEAVLLEALQYAKAPTPRLFQAIAEALQAFPTPKVRQALRHLAHHNPWEEVRREAVFSLAVLGETSVAEELKRIACSDPDEERRRRADIALKWLEFYTGRRKPLLDMLQQNPLETTEALLLLLKYPSNRKAQSLLLLAKNHPEVARKYGRDIDRRLCFPDNQLER